MACRSLILSSVQEQPGVFLGGAAFGLEGFPHTASIRQRSVTRVKSTEDRYFSQAVQDSTEEGQAVALEEPEDVEGWLRKGIETLEERVSGLLPL